MAMLVKRPHMMMVQHTVAVFGITIRRNGDTVHVSQDEILRNSESLREELDMDEGAWIDILTELQELIRNCPPPSANDTKKVKPARRPVTENTDLMAMLKASLGQ